MDKPPPYETPEKSPVIEKPAPTFHIRSISKSDAKGMLQLNERIFNTLTVTRDDIAPFSKVEASIQIPPIHNIVQLVAVSTTQAKPRGISGLINKFASHTIEKSSKEKASEVLGYAHFIPFQTGGPDSSYNDRTATMIQCTLSSDELGVELWRAVNLALMEEICAKSVEEGHRYKTVVTSITFRQDQPSLVAYRDLFLEAGFEQVGCLKEVVEKAGILLDRVMVQKML